MLGRAVGISTACALGASALIIPPGIAPASNGEAPDLSISVVNPKNQVITIPCAECAFLTKQENVENIEEDGDDLFWIQGGENSLLLNFTVSEDGQRLQLNGGDIYPPRQQANWALPETIYVKQVPSQAGLVDIKSGEVRSADLEITAYGIKQSEMQALSPNGDMLVPVTFEIMGLENQVMTIDEVEIKLLKTGDGELLIMQVESLPGHGSSVIISEPLDEDMDAPPPPHFDGPPPPAEMDEGEDMDFPPPPHFHGPPHPHRFGTKECNMLPEPLCRLSNMLDHKIDQMMDGHHHGGFRQMGGCRGRKGHPNSLPGHIKPHFGKPDKEDHHKHPHGRHHHVRPHGPHHRHHGHFRHHFVHAFAKGLVAVLIPVMAGITVGMVVSLIGLVVGRLIGFLWIKLARGGRRGYASVAQEEAIAELGDEKFMVAEVEALPAYEDAPADEESQREQK